MDMTRIDAVEIISQMKPPKKPSEQEALRMGLNALRQMDEIEDIVHHCDNYEDVAYNVLYVVDSNQYK